MTEDRFNQFSTRECGSVNKEVYLAHISNNCVLFLRTTVLLMCAAQVLYYVCFSAHCTEYFYTQVLRLNKMKHFAVSSGTFMSKPVVIIPILIHA